MQRIHLLEDTCSSSLESSFQRPSDFTLGGLGLAWSKQNQAAGPIASMGTEFKKASHALKELDNYMPLCKL